MVLKHLKGLKFAQWRIKKVGELKIHCDLFKLKPGNSGERAIRMLIKLRYKVKAPKNVIGQIVRSGQAYL
jgi:hypothetical protein